MAERKHILGGAARLLFHTAGGLFDQGATHGLET